jgi:hypothetical protein
VKVEEITTVNLVTARYWMEGCRKGEARDGVAVSFEEVFCENSYQISLIEGGLS